MIALVITFLTIATAILLLAHYVVYSSLVSILSIESIQWLWTLRVVFLLLSISFIGSSVLVNFFDDAYSQFIYKISAIWLGFLTYIFFASCIYGIIIGIAQYANFNIPKLIFGLLFFLIAIGISIYGVIHAKSIVVKTDIVSLKNLPDSWKNRNIVWISDIHLGAVNGATFANEVTDRINSLNPDIVFIGGDLYDGVKVEDDSIIEPLKNLHPRLGTYFITGNHEEFRDKSHFVQAIEKIGIKVLDNKLVNIDGLQIIGVDDRDSTNKTLYESILGNMKIDKSKPSILLKHQPFQLDIAEKEGISLQISGHTHKAQIYPFSLITKLIYRGYDYGLHDYGNMQVLTSSGVGTWGPPLRVGSDAEINLIELK